MAMIQDDDPKAAFVFVGDFNADHREWLNSRRITRSSGHGSRSTTREGEAFGTWGFQGQDQGPSVSRLTG